MQRDSFTPEWLTIAQVARLSQYSEKTIRRAIKARDLRAHQRKQGGTWRIALEDYDRWMLGQVPSLARPA